MEPAYPGARLPWRRSNVSLCKADRRPAGAFRPVLVSCARPSPPSSSSHGSLSTVLAYCFRELPCRICNHLSFTIWPTQALQASFTSTPRAAFQFWTSSHSCIAL